MIIRHEELKRIHKCNGVIDFAGAGSVVISKWIMRCCHRRQVIAGCKQTRIEEDGILRAVTCKGSLPFGQSQKTPTFHSRVSRLSHVVYRSRNLSSNDITRYGIWMPTEVLGNGNVSNDVPRQIVEKQVFNLHLPYATSTPNIQ